MTDHMTQTSTGRRGTGANSVGLIDSEHLTDTERHDVLASERRRTVLDVLAGRATQVDLEDLAATVAARESGVDEDDPRAVERVAVSLHHNHLPRMAELDVLDYDAASNRVG